MRTSGLFKNELETDDLGKPQSVVSFRHELIGKFLAARHIRQMLQNGKEEQWKDLLSRTNNETWLDVLGFIIDELDSQSELSSFVRELISRGNEVTMRAAGYALFRKPNLIEDAIKDLYTDRRIEEDSRRVAAEAA